MTDEKQGPKMDSAELQPTGRPLTFGERLVGITFSPSNNPKVDRAKAICAELADLILEDRIRYNNAPPNSINPAEGHLFSHTVGQILNAQMNVVKLLTLK